MKLRKYRASDCQAVTELFYNTVHLINTKGSTQEQLDAWAAEQVDFAEWN